ncbi:MAG: Uma2 family endonuclease [Cyanobacteria bacterium J06649_11]
MTYTLNLQAFTDSIGELDLAKICGDNPDLRFETDKNGKLIIMSPTGSLTGERNADLIYQVQFWNRQSKLGVVFDSSTGFRLFNGAIRSPDVSWIAIERWNSLNDEQKRGFAPIDPDFVVELLSPTDKLAETQQKMREYMDCGVKLGWLINPDSRKVEIYRNGREKEILESPSSVSGEDILTGLNIDLTEIF